MRLIRSMELGVETDATGVLLARVLAAVDSTVPVWTYLENRSGVKTSAVDCAVKKYPSLAALGPPQRGSIRAVLASLPERNGEPFAAPIDRDVALSIARDVPKSLPFMYSNFVIGPIPELWIGLGEPQSPTVIASHISPRDALACVVVSSSWWTSRRQLKLAAHLCM